LSQAGEDTDVILGMGYDNSLGSSIGITMIATGFKEKDPFSKESKIEKSLDSNKVVFELDIPKEPSFAIPVTKEIVLETKAEPEVITPSKVVFELETPVVNQKSETPVSENPMMPTLSVNTQEETTQPQFYEISSSADQIPTTTLVFEELAPVAPAQEKVTFILEEEPTTQDISKPQESTDDASPLSSGGYLAKPAQIYAEESPMISESNTIEDQQPLQKPVQEDEPVIEMQLVVKDSSNAAEEPVVQQTQPIMNSSVEEPAMLDETEELRRRAAERIAKLRNLSFNVNTADPNNEFETVPAYLRRNMEMQVQIADVESFYSNYTVKPTEENQASISTLNTFLNGKKPD
jgi:cell division protein FtsZ